ncbi:2-keto-3-deoxygluconate kinase [Sporosarcina sp. P21c]|uniref:sugar kinase n=1 Tax=unclassified Sporosarcina TaxID=2647733 RepID=UPI000C172E6D|nr:MULTISPECIES: sugar kinase [unclassified Sporosarcina]PIC67832.1 2-keto-3-deoxygluconate kinase [Sporosarcina sp. P16a]PIC83825.1 2-keto-3-deoxygluconate kinase [Sporosarcina sp. P1]PIC90691.1 2-keto-3-deoxygluconate kinase [Sporosarcina sp. P21c]PIC93456.1 2-keto-3-deoxygluconate kinase [Sporosarcina sp. P25]
MSTNFNVLTIGDAMITMDPITKGPMRFVTHFERKMGGAELNFAIGCSRLGLNSKWISRLGQDEFGKVIYNFARGEGIDVKDVDFVDGYTTSVNFKEVRESGEGKTFYYRQQSPILTLRVEDINEHLLDSIDLLHITGVFLAIDPQNLAIAKRLITLANEKNIPVSFDPNIRLKLWTIEDARKAYFEIFQQIDILLTGLDEIHLILEDSSETALIKFANDYNITDLVIKDSSAGSRLYKKGQWFTSPAFEVPVIDTVGAGDGFDAGYVYSYLNDLEPKEALRFANGVGALVVSVLGDNEGLPYLSEVQSFTSGTKEIER